MFIYFIDLYLIVLLGLTLFSNFTYFWCLMFLIGMSRVKDKKNDSSFARIRTALVFSGFF